MIYSLRSLTASGLCVRNMHKDVVFVLADHDAHDFSKLASPANGEIPIPPYTGAATVEVHHACFRL